MTINSLVKSLRQFRLLHRYVGVVLAFFFLIIGLTGIMLGWKKNVAAFQPATHDGRSAELSQWKDFSAIAFAALRGMDSTGNKGNVIDRMDVRPDKGIIKVLFKYGYWEVQVDGKTAQVLSVAQRHSDWIEHIHDGSFVGEFFKLIYTNVLGAGLLTLSLTGVWLWYGPKAVRKLK